MSERTKPEDTAADEGDAGEQTGALPLEHAIGNQTKPDHGGTDADDHDAKPSGEWGVSRRDDDE